MNIFYRVTLSDVEYLIQAPDGSDAETTLINPYPEFSIPIVKEITDKFFPNLLNDGTITAETFCIDLDWLNKHIARNLYAQGPKKELDYSAYYSAYRLFKVLVAVYRDMVYIFKKAIIELKKSNRNPKWDLNKELPKFIMATLKERIEVFTSVIPSYNLSDGSRIHSSPEDHSKIIITAFSILLNVQRGTPLLGRYREEPLSLEESEYVAKNECASLEVNRQLIDSLLREHDTENSKV